LTVSDFLQDWLADVVKVNAKPKTYQQYCWAINQHIVPALGRSQLRQLTPQHVQHFITQASQSGLAPKSVKALRDTLRAAL